MEIVNENKIEEATKKYLKDNEGEIEALINKKISSSIKSAINKAFATESYSNHEGWARKKIFGIVDEKVKKETRDEAIKIDTDELQEKVNSAVKAKLRKLDVSIRF